MVVPQIAGFVTSWTRVGTAADKSTLTRCGTSPGGRSPTFLVAATGGGRVGQDVVVQVDGSWWVFDRPITRDWRLSWA
jgi:hypothetical protein